MNHDKTKVWSDGQDGSADDMMTALGDDQSLDVLDRQTRSGMLFTANCKHCPRQGKHKMMWSEVCMIYQGQVPNVQPPPWKPTRQGVWIPLTCACGNVTPMLVDWDEVRRWVSVGVRTGALSPEILRLGL